MIRANVLAGVLSLASIAFATTGPVRGDAQGSPAGDGTGKSHWRFDFGGTRVASGYTAVDHRLEYTAEHAYGWVTPADHLRDRGAPDALRRDFVFSRSPATFRVDVPPGVYRIMIVTGDLDYGDHAIRVAMPGVTTEPIMLDPAHAEFVTVSMAGTVAAGGLEFRFTSPVDNWVVNALTIEPARKPEPATFTRKLYRRTAEELDTWEDVSSWPDPIAPHVQRFRRQLASNPPFCRTGLTRGDYLAVIAGVVDYFKQHQEERGAIIDPYRGVEYQYATPCFALAATTLAVHAGRDDLLEPAARAMDWATETLTKRQAATAHEDFFSPQIGHALPLLKSRVDATRLTRWEEHIRAFDPYATYRASPGGGNWNVVALSGEALFCRLGLRANRGYVDSCIAAQGRFFKSPWGLYTEGPMAYDHFPRMWAADMLSTGFEGRNTDKLREVLRRGAVTSLFMQSPTGELPVGGRSAHHQWNEAQQCATYEIYAAVAATAGDRAMAGVFKRAARLALGSITRWVRPSGELWIVKNRNDPAARHGYEGYSSHSQYNLLAVAMLAIAYGHATSTEDVPEQPTPADVGGFVIRLPRPFHKVIANAGGLYVEVDYNADLAHNSTGLLRIHKSGCNPQIGPSDGLTAQAVYLLPDGPRTTAAVGIAWRDNTGGWRRLAQSGRYHGKPAGPSAPLTARLDEVEQSTERVTFQLTYDGNFDGPDRIVERYVVTPRQVDMTTELMNYRGPTRMIWPVLANNGAGQLDIDVTEKRIAVSSEGSMQVFEPGGATTVCLEAPLYACRNGWARLAFADFPAGSRAALRIRPTAKRNTTRGAGGSVPAVGRTPLAGGEDSNQP
ncbi:MAG: hypothetical protein JSV19_03635 [Phycisphaerales bacterium]|nr:MAG: hypothetical protein JSV19_03635 [Phycisphaerales bacterium]